MLFIYNGYAKIMTDLDIAGDSRIAPTGLCEHCGYAF